MKWEKYLVPESWWETQPLGAFQLFPEASQSGAVGRLSAAAVRERIREARQQRAGLRTEEPRASHGPIRNPARRTEVRTAWRAADSPSRRPGSPVCEPLPSTQWPWTLDGQGQGPASQDAGSQPRHCPGHSSSGTKTSSLDETPEGWEKVLLSTMPPHLERFVMGPRIFYLV